jgi:hypothetical protein
MGAMTLPLYYTTFADSGEVRRITYSDSQAPA